MKILSVFTSFTKSLTIIFITSLLLLSVFAGNAAATGFGVGVGVFAPVGSNARHLNPGLGVNVHLDTPLAPLLNLRLAGNYNRATGSLHGTKYTFTSTGGQALVILAPPVPIIQPYAGLGYGVYRNSTKATFNGASTTKHNWGSGVVAQAGIGIDILILNVGLDAQYMMNMNGGTDFGGYTIGARVSLAL